MRIYQEQKKDDLVLLKKKPYCQTVMEKQVIMKSSKGDYVKASQNRKI